MARANPVGDAAEARYQTIVFLNAVVPVLKPIVAARPALARGFAGRTGVVQVSALDAAGAAASPTGPDGRRPRLATHLVVDDGELTVRLGPHPAPNVELEFGSTRALNTFFTGGLALPRIRGGAANAGLLAATVKALLAMASLLGAKTPPEDADEADLLVRCLFYLLTTGISQLNKAGHPRVAAWASRQPDRVYALEVTGRDELAAHLRVKAGRTRASRGRYTRSRPFFTMAFDSTRSALGILLETEDMLESTMAGRITMQGAPEYGAELGELMLLVGGYAK